MTVRSRGRPKYSAASAVMREVARNRLLAPAAHAGRVAAARGRSSRGSRRRRRPRADIRSRACSIRRSTPGTSGVVHVAEAGAGVGDAVVGVAEIVDHEPLGGRHVRDRRASRSTGSRRARCSAWRCSTLARIASGAVTLVRLRNTAVPGTRCTGGVRSCRSSMNSRSDPSSCSRRCVTSSRPRCQVVRTVNAVTPISSGSHAPCDELGQVRGQEQQVDGEQGAGAERDQPQRLVPTGGGRCRRTAAS